jgi:hypothetical protein
VKLGIQTVHETLSQKPIIKRRLVEWLKVKALSSRPSMEKNSCFSGLGNFEDKNGVKIP